MKKGYFKKIPVLLILITIHTSVLGQPREISRYDTLRGKLHDLRNCFKVFYYDLNLRIDPSQKFITGHNTIHYNSIKSHNQIQIDLFSNLKLDSITSPFTISSIERDSNFIFIRFKEVVPKEAINHLTIYYQGSPQEAVRPPWDGGFVWSTDSLNRTWAGVAVEGTGASLWWPNKDHITEKPDSMRMAFEVPDDLTCVSNGRLLEKQDLQDGFTRFTWEVTYPINNYNVTLNIANYSFIEDKFTSSSGEVLDLHYYILDYNEEKAKKHFRQTKHILAEFENLYSPYPFIRDSYKLIETPYWGMEHQSAISYGNNYRTDFFDFDYIILHETAHEWWGNSITAADHGELWIHESFATYTEALYIEKKFGYESALKYLNYQKKMIKNKEPILGPLNINYHYWEHPDMYYKGAWMLHTLRTVIDNDSLWFSIFENISKDFAHTIVSTEDIIGYFNKKTKHDLTTFFNRYLKYSEPPVFHYQVHSKRNKHVLIYKWDNKEPKFEMPVDIIINNGELLRIYPKAKKQRLNIKEKAKPEIKIRNDFYIKSSLLN